jgi:peptidoglycan/xylan/chitin deacetylase (PgdA/CDA1 family)
MLRDHLEHLSKKYPIVLPGDPIPLHRLHICLTFDDAYFDFYHIVFPLLKEFKIPAVLAVPIHYVIESTDLSPDVRLSVSHKEAMIGNTYKEKVPFCTWKELREMVASGYVKIASHSLTHPDLTLPGVDLEKEIALSKKNLEEKLQTPIDTFVFPLGKFNKNVLNLTQKHYRFAMRIGSAYNLTWQNSNGLIYRVPSDALQDKAEKLKPLARLAYFFSYLIHSFRGR